MRRVLLALAALLVAASPLRANDRELSWDSGTLAGKRSAAGTGHEIGFSAPQGRWYLETVRIYGARYGGGYSPPSGLFRFRMGVTDRRTPIRRVQPEGVGTAPDVFVPYEPVLLAGGADPIRRTGREILEALVAGAPRGDLVSFADGILRGDAKEVSHARSAIAPWTKKGVMPGLEAMLQPSIDWQITLLENPNVAMPEFVAGASQLRAWGAVAAVLGRKDLAKRAEEAAQGDEKDAAAQVAWEALVRSGRAGVAKARAEFCARHRGTRYAAAVEAAYR